MRRTRLHFALLVLGARPAGVFLPDGDLSGTSGWGAHAFCPMAPLPLLRVRVLLAVGAVKERGRRIRASWKEGSAKQGLQKNHSLRKGQVSTLAGRCQLGQLLGKSFVPRCQLLCRPCGPRSPHVSFPHPSLRKARVHGTMLPCFRAVISEWPLVWRPREQEEQAAKRGKNCPVCWAAISFCPLPRAPLI